jgi:predicted GNAT superfamily acetyltransferase
MPNYDFRIPGVLNSKEMLVAEAIQARAWEFLSHDGRVAAEQAEAAKIKLGGIVVRLMSDRSRSIGDLAEAAVAAFRNGS